MTSVLIVAAMLSAGGFPSPQSRADYRIAVTLNPDSCTLSGTVEIDFLNGAPVPVDTLWLHLYPNAYRDYTTPFGQDLESVGRYSFRAAPQSDRGWVDLAGWTAGGDSVTPSVDSDLAFIVLDSPLQPESTLTLGGGFEVHVPLFWSRMGHSGETFQLTQWYPKMCVLDGSGWHRGRYRWRGEFFSDFGDYSVSLTLPNEYVTAATGSCDTVEITPDSLTRTELWTASTVHDFAWAASPWYELREHTFTYPDSLGGSWTRVHLVLLYGDEGRWEDVPAVIDSTLLYYGQWFTPYPYRDLWVVEPAVLSAGGMEYPQLVFSAADFPLLRVLEVVTMHEVGHQWFYGMLANDEVEEAWLDEGMNSWAELRYMERRHGFHGNYSTTPDWVLELSDLEGNLDTYAASVAGGETVPVLSNATEGGDGSYSTGATYYAKPALFLRMLQSQAGEDAFDRAMDTYFQRFMFSHPHTEDFQAILEEETGRSWETEFDYWLRSTGSADVWVSGLTVSADSTLVVLSGEVPHPVDLEVLLLGNGDSLLTSGRLSPGVPSDPIAVAGAWEGAVADPFGRMPDRAPWNNGLPALSQLRPLVLPLPRPTRVSTWAVAFPSYADGSWRAELGVLSTPMPDFMGGPCTWSGGLSVPFSKGSSSSWSTSFRMPVYRNPRRTVSITTRLSRGWGMGEAAARLGISLPGRVQTDPRWGVGVGLALESVEDTTVLGGANIEEGTGIELDGALSYADENYRLSFYGDASALASPGWSEGAYAAADLHLQVSLRIAGESLARTRFYLGRVIGGVPVQRRLRPGGGLFPEDGIVGALLPPDGPLSPSEHYFVSSGPALPGYQGSMVRGRAALTLEQRLPLPLPFLEPEVFAGAGWVEDGFSEFSSDNLIANAGIALRMAFLEALFPIWVSDPLPGDDNWELRWRVGLSPWGFPDLY
jgi:hypothetical protein